MDIPEIIKQEAETRGWSSVKLVGEKDGMLLFAEPPLIDDDGYIVPTGLPKYIMLAGGKVIYVDGESGLGILRFFNDK